MKKKLTILTLISICLYLLATNFPKENYEINDENIKIKISITENLLIFRDPEYTKKIRITDGTKEFQIKYWSEIQELKILKRINKTEVFWVIDDNYSGLTRTIENEFTDFTCADCSAVEKLIGDNILCYELKNNTFNKIKF